MKHPDKILFAIIFSMYIFGTASSVHAGQTITETRISSNNSGQYKPTIHGDKIVWYDYRNGNDSDIYMYDLSTDTETRITNDPSDQFFAYIDNGRIVWDDKRNGKTDTYLYDISSATERQITTNDQAQGDSVIYGDRIVWDDDRNGDFDIYMFDLSTDTETRITSSSADQTVPDIYGDTIVWRDYRNAGDAIYMYDISTGIEAPIPGSGNNLYFPAIYDDKIVWVSDANGNSNVHMYDISTGTETQITDSSSTKSDPTIYSNKIAWLEYRTGWTKGAIFMFDLSTGTETRITTAEADPGRMAIYGNKIVWEDYRDNVRSIYMAAIETTSDDVNTSDDDQKAHIDSWNAYLYDDKTNGICRTKLKLEIKGKHFDDAAEVKIESEEADWVRQKNSEKMTAAFCLQDLLDIKTDHERWISVKNPHTSRTKAAKQVDLNKLYFKLTDNSFDPETTEGAKEIQQALYTLGYFERENIIGAYGPLTRSAVSKFQANNGLPATGYVGALTKAKLSEKVK